MKKENLKEIPAHDMFFFRIWNISIAKSND